MKTGFRKLLDNDKFVWMCSILVAIILWFAVRISIDKVIDFSVKNVPVSINTQSSTISKLELHALDGGETTVTVNVRGDGTVVGGLSSDDFTVMADLSKVTGPGTVELPLEAVNSSGKEFEVTGVNPSSISVNFDRLLTKKLPIEADIDGISVSEEYVVEQETVTPGEINITGPEIDVNKVDRCVAVIEVGEQLNKPAVFKSEVVLLDKEGNVVESPYITTDVTTAEVVIPVKKIVELPLTIKFTNIPTGFPIDELVYTLSNETITVAGIPDVVDRYREINLGYVDIKELDFSQDYNFNVELPAGFTNVDNIETVVVDFDETNIDEQTFTITGDRITIKNRPADYEVTVTTTRVSNVRILGDRNVLSKLTAGDIIAEIDLSNRNVQVGQFSVPLTIYMPTKGLVWAVGSYDVIINVREQ